MLNVIRPTRTNKKQTNKKPQNKNEKQTQKTDCKLSKINNKKKKRKKKHALKYWYFLGEEKINLFVKGIPSNPFVVFPLELANTGSYSGYFFH